MKLFIFIFLISSVVVFAGYDPLDTVDGTESWYKGSNEKEEAVSYYDSSYEEDVKMYLAYLKSKQNKSKFKKAETSPFKNSTKTSRKINQNEENMDELDRIEDKKNIESNIDETINTDTTDSIIDDNPTAETETKTTNKKKSDDVSVDDLGTKNSTVDKLIYKDSDASSADHLFENGGYSKNTAEINVDSGNSKTTKTSTGVKKDTKKDTKKETKKEEEIEDDLDLD